MCFSPIRILHTGSFLTFTGVIIHIQVMQHRVVLEVPSSLSSHDRLEVVLSPTIFYEYQNKTKQTKKQAAKMSSTTYWLLKCVNHSLMVLINRKSEK